MSTGRRSFMSLPVAALALVVMALIAGIGILAMSVTGPAGLSLALVAGVALILAQRIAAAGETAVASARADVILESLSSAMVVIDPDGTIDDINAAAIALFEYTPTELVGQNISILMPEAIGRDHQSYTKAFHGTKQRMGAGREVVALARSGREVPVEIFVTSIKLAGARKIVGVVNDITERRAHEKKMTELVSDLQRANAELDQFAYVASHDLKAPLRVIENTSQWLAEDLADVLTTDTRESLDMLQNRVQRMERLLNALLELSRIGRVRRDSEMMAGGALAENILSSLTVPDGFKVVFDPSFLSARLPSAPLNVVLRHLIDNAIRHHDRSEGRVDVSLAVEDGMPALLVRDDGPGIEPQYHDRVFEPFQTLIRRDERETEGMGLTIVQKHVTLVGGSISFVPHDGRGAAVRLVWPVEAETEPNLEVVA